MERNLQAKTTINLRLVLSIAAPMMVSQASETVMLFVDRLFLSQLGKLYISSSMSGGLTVFTVSSLFLSTIGYVNAIVAQHDGAGHKNPCAKAAYQALGLSILAWPLLISTIPLVRQAFFALGHTSAQIDLEMKYFSILMFGVVLQLARTALGGFFMGLGRTKIVMVANIIGMLINIPANYVLIFGKFGIAPLGIQGAALGTLFGSFTAFVILLLVFLSRKYRKEFSTHRAFGYDKKLSGTLLKFGVPAGVETFLNVTAFSLFVQLMHSYGPDTAAAVTIAFNYDMVAFIPLLGLGFAVTTLTGRYIGKKDPEGAVKATKISLLFGLMYAAIMASLFVIASGPLVRLFTQGFEAVGGEVESLAKIMLRLAALYTIADATQVIFAGALRGAGDTRFVMWISVVLHWVLAGLAILFVKVIRIPPVSMWIVFIGFVFCLGVGMVARFRWGDWKDKSLL